MMNGRSYINECKKLVLPSSSVKYVKIMSEFRLLMCVVVGVPQQWCWIWRTIYVE